jgi:gliding motility-associated lipoprotein GldH
MIKGINSFSFVLILMFLLLLLSCNSNTIYTSSHPMTGEIWNLSDIATFKVPVTDTLNSNNVVFNIRNGSSYPFRNIFLFVTTTAPDGKKITDTLQYNLADEKGKWYGKGFGDLHELKLPYKTNVFFPAKGIYEFRIQHGMRIENLKGVYDFGLRIEKYKK